MPAIAGAPDGFRLDTWEDWVADDGRVVRGAGTMAPRYIQDRVDPDRRQPGVEAMPPEDGFASLSDRQIDILVTWADNLDGDRRAARGAPRDGNQPPTMTILDTRPNDDDGDVVTLDYEIHDPDLEIVAGELRVGIGGDADGADVITRELHSGRGQITWDTGQFPNGTYSYFAVLTDPSGAHTVDVAGSHEVAHGGNTAPTVTIASPRRDALLAEAEAATFDIDVVIADPDAADTFTLSIEAFRRDETATVVADQPAVSGSNLVTWDITGVPDGLDWRLRATVSDGTATRTAETGELIVSHTTTTETFADVSAQILSVCIGCHPNTLIPGLPHDFQVLDGGPDAAGVRDLRGLIYRRVVQQRNMPPASFNTPLDDALIARLGEWLLAGAPE